MIALPNILANAVFQGSAPFSEKAIHEWADETVTLPPGGYSVSGKFKSSSVRHLIEPLAALADDSVRRVTIRKATQTCGTLVADLYVPWTFEHRPGAILWLFQKKEIARDHCRTRIGRLIAEGCSSIKHLLPENPNDLHVQEFILRNGIPGYVRGPSLNELQSKSIRHLIRDEVWLYKPGVLAESEERVAAFERVGTSKILDISQGSLEGDQFDLSCTKSEFKIWNVPCPVCRQLQRLRMEERDPNGKRIYRMNWNKAGSEVWLTCKFCSEKIVWSDSLRAMQNKEGAYRLAEDSKAVATHKGFSWPSMIMNPWPDVVDEYRQAIAAMRNGVLNPLQKFVQKEMGESWQVRDWVQRDVIELRSEDYEPNAEHPNEKFRGMSVDCQGNLLELVCAARAWDKDGSSRLLKIAKVQSVEEIRALQLELKIRDQFVALDARYETQKVYAICARFVGENGLGWFAMMGSDRTEFEHHLKDEAGKPYTDRRAYSERKTVNPMIGLKNADVEGWRARATPKAVEFMRAGKLRVRLFLWSNPTVKDVTANLRDGKGAKWVAATEILQSPFYGIYCRELKGEIKRKRRDAAGFWFDRWEQVGPNHFWDCENMNTTAAMMHGILRIDISERVKKTETTETKETKGSAETPEGTGIDVASEQTEHEEYATNT